MQRNFVASSDLRSVGYDPTSKTLEIEFHGGNIYQYFNVPQYIYNNLMNSASKGKYFHTFVKHYPYRKIS